MKDQRTTSAMLQTRQSRTNANDNTLGLRWPQVSNKNAVYALFVRHVACAPCDPFAKSVDSLSEPQSPLKPLPASRALSASLRSRRAWAVEAAAAVGVATPGTAAAPPGAACSGAGGGRRLWRLAVLGACCAHG